MQASSDTQVQKLVDLARSGNGSANELLINDACDRLTGAALDGLTHRCLILETKGENYRL